MALQFKNYIARYHYRSNHFNLVTRTFAPPNNCRDQKKYISRWKNGVTPNHEKSQTIVSPIDIRPFPKASARKTIKNNRRKRETAILTDSPIKNQLEQEKLMRKIKPKKTKQQNYNTKKTIVPKVPKKRKISTDHIEEEECFCLVCLEPFSNSRPREKWIQCMECKEWSHKECTSGNIRYVCHNCDSPIVSDASSD